MAPRFMSLWKNINGGFGLAILVLGAVGLVSYRGTDEMVVTATRVDHTHEVLYVIARTRFSLQEAETEARGYLLSSRPDRLYQYSLSTLAIHQNLHRLGWLIRYNPYQQRRLEVIEPLVARRLALLERSLALHRAALPRTDNFPKDVTQIHRQDELMARGDELEAQVGIVASQMEAEERGRLRHRSDTAEATARTTQAIIGFGTLLALGLAMVASWRIKEDTRLRLRAEETLRERERLLKLITDAAPALIAYIGPDLRYRFVNKEYLNFFNLPLGSIVGKTMEELIGPQPYAVIRGYAETALSGQFVSYETALTYPKVGERYILCSYSPHYDSEGAPCGFVIMVSDITDRREAEEALRHVNEGLEMRVLERTAQLSEHQAFLRQVIDTDPNFIFVKDAGGSFLLANAAVAEAYGTTPEALVGGCDADFNPNLIELEQFHRTDRELLTSGVKQIEFEEAMTDAQGRRRLLHTVKRPLPAAGSTLTRVLGICTDITERKKAEEERDRFFTLSLDMLAIVSNDGYFRRLNPAFEATLGFSDVELMAKPFLEFVHPDDMTTTQAAVATLESGVPVTSFENRYVCKNGSYKWLRWMSAPYKDLWYCVAHDITGIKQAEAALHHANDELELRVLERTEQIEISHREMSIAKEEAEQANAAKSDFLSRMSHELRTPMNSIMGFAQIMEMDAPSDKQAVRLGHILRAGQHLLQLINEVLDLARVESGRLQLSLEPVSLATCIQSAVDMIWPLCEQRDQQIICDFGAWEPLYVRADQQRLTQVLINLLSNATKYNRDGGVILVNCEHSREGWQQISISDSGAGIPAEQLAKLFQPFERLGADGSPIEGTGLGLALSKRLVELMGGTISVESVVGSGSTFVIELPRAQHPGQEIETMSSHLALPDDNERRYTILYVEDNLANLQLIEHVLSGRPQYQLRSAMGGLIGLDMARDLLPSLILLDLHLPDLPGDEVLARLQADPLTRDIPVVIVSADATPGQIRRLLASGAAEYLTKPLDMRLFNDVLHKILQLNEKKEG